MSSNNRRYPIRSSRNPNPPSSGSSGTTDKSSNRNQTSSNNNNKARTGALSSQTNQTMQYSYQQPRVAHNNQPPGPMYSQQYPYSGVPTMYSGFFPPENPSFMPISSVSNTPIYNGYVNYRQYPNSSNYNQQHGASLSILTHSGSTSNNVTFSKLNLYEEVKVLIKPVSISDPKVVKYFDTKEIVPYLTTHDDRYCVLIRFCKYSSNAREQVDRLPKEFNLVINNTALQVRNKYSYTPYDITSRVMAERQGRKQTLAFKIIFDPNSQANLDQDPSGLYYGVFLMKKLDHESALANFIAKSPLDINVSLDIVKQALNTDEIAIVDDLKQIKISLLCPISATKIKTPARSSKCEHVHCFDAESFFSINAKTPRWKCPVCMTFIKLDDLIIDSLILNILKDAPPEVTEAIIFEDGKFEYIQEEQQNTNTTNSAVTNSSLPSSSQPSSSAGKRKIEDETPKSDVKVAKVQKEIEWITIDSDDDDDDIDENKSDKASTHSSQSKVDEDSDSDIEIVFEKIVPPKRSNSRVTADNDRNDKSNYDSKPRITPSKSNATSNESTLDSNISEASTSSSASLSSSTAQSFPSQTFPLLVNTDLNSFKK